MADGSDSSSELSEHSDKEFQKLAPIFAKAKKATKLVAPPPVVSPPRPKRPPSPPHEEVLADNGDIPFLVMFRSRFSDAMSSKVPHLGPQDIERGVMNGPPSPQVEQLLCALLALVLNRKKPVERGHHGRALEEAVLTQKSQWPIKWQGQNPLHGGNTFESMNNIQRLDLLRTLATWALSTSDAIQTIIKERYKQQRHNDDENQPLSVQPWGSDGDKRRYFLVQGLDDTGFRVYREASRYTKNAQWWSVAGDIDEVKALSTKLEELDGSQAARRLAIKITNAIPMFEATEEKRRRREYRQIRRAAFSRPEPGFSLYEGRTRGKRMRYTYDDDDSFLSDDTSNRHSNRHSARSTPFEPGPTYTASGRQVRQPKTGDYGESLLSNGPINADELALEYVDGEEGSARRRSASDDSDDPVRGRGRATRSGGRHTVPQSGRRKHIDGYNDIDELSNEEDADASNDGWDSEKNESQDDEMPDADDEDEEMSENDSEVDEEPQTLVVKLRVPSEVMTKPLEKTSDSMDLDAGPLDDVALEDFSGAGAVKDETKQPSNSANPVGSHPASSPTGPSGYPTPTSASFISTEQKPVMVTATSLRAPVSSNTADNVANQLPGTSLGESAAEGTEFLKEPLSAQVTLNGLHSDNGVHFGKV